MSFRPSRYILSFLGSVTLLLTASTTVFFTLYSISTLSARSVIASSCTAAAVFNIVTCILLLLFIILPSQKRLYLLGGITSTVLAVILSTLALGWMSFRPQDMPNIMFGRDRDPMVIAGFSLFVVSLVFQTIFWTLQVFTCPRSSDKSKEGLEFTPAEIAEKSIPPYDFSPSNPPSTTLGDEKYSAFVENVLHHTPNLYNSTVLYVTEAPPFTEHVEVDPFDTWDTSDVGATHRAACALAVGLGIFKPVKNDIAGGVPEENGVESNRIEEEADDVQIHVPVLERQNSPPIPDYDMTPRSTSFPAGIFREHTSIASIGRRPTLVVSPIGESREFDEGSGRLVPTRSPRGDLGTGKWLVRSQNMM